MSIAEIILKIRTLCDADKPVIVAIDGRCGSGKTTLAERLREEFEGNVIHMDDFFLRPEQRSQKRLAKAGENIDHERFLREVLQPLQQGGSFSYRPFDCGQMALGAPIQVPPKALTIVEGSYSCHPELWEYYDLRIFCDIDAPEQMRRITARDGEKWAQVFASEWIPLEETYFDAFSLRERCDIIYNT